METSWSYAMCHMCALMLNLCRIKICEKLEVNLHKKLNLYLVALKDEIVWLNIEEG